jgi:hypothetical protein
MPKHHSAFLWKKSIKHNGDECVDKNPNEGNPYSAGPNHFYPICKNSFNHRNFLPSIFFRHHKTEVLKKNFVCPTLNKTSKRML